MLTEKEKQSLTSVASYVMFRLREYPYVFPIGNKSNFEDAIKTEANAIADEMEAILEKQDELDANLPKLEALSERILALATPVKKYMYEQEMAGMNEEYLGYLEEALDELSDFARFIPKRRKNSDCYE